MLRLNRFALLLLAGFFLLGGCSKPPGDNALPRPALVMQPILAESGGQMFPAEVVARQEPELAFRVGGKISARQVEVGDRVGKGQLLAELDAEDARLDLTARQARVASAQARLKHLAAENQRYQRLAEHKLISQSQADNAAQLYQVAQQELKSLQAEAELSRNSTAHNQLRAPEAGVIAERFAEVGQVVAAGQRIFSLATQGGRDVLIHVPEHSLQRVRLGDNLPVELWSQPGHQYTGVVREISPLADPMTRTYATRITLPADMPAELGQSASVFVAAPGSALTVPLQAVSAENGQPFVWVVDPHSRRLQRRAVRIGAYGRERVPVLEGLSSHDWVVAGGVQLLSEGQEVRPVDRDNRPVSMEEK